MKIFRILDNFSEKIDRGLSINAFYLSKNEIERGHQTYLFSIHSDGVSRWQQKNLEGINYFYRRKTWKKRISTGFLIAQKIRQLEIKPDVIHGMQAVPFGWGFPTWKRHFPKTKFVLSIHADIHPLRRNYVKGLKNRLDSWEFSKLILFLAKRVDLVVPLAEYVAEDLRNEGIDNQNLVVIPPGLDFDLFRADRTNKNTDRFEVLFIGRFTQMKGMRTLVRAVKLLAKEKFHFTLIGGNPNDNEFSIVNKVANELGPEKISIRGAVPQKDLRNYFKQAQVFILPSIFEPRGKVILEAMASRVPVIATNKGGIPEIVNNNINGILIPPHDPEILVEKLRELSENKALGQMIVTNGWLTAKQFDWPQISNRYLSNFQRIS